MRKHESRHHSPSDTSIHAVDTHGHTHGAIDPALFTTRCGMWAVNWSFLGLAPRPCCSFSSYGSGGVSHCRPISRWNKAMTLPIIEATNVSPGHTAIWSSRQVCMCKFLTIRSLMKGRGISINQLLGSGPR